jgi:flavodoxin
MKFLVLYESFFGNTEVIAQTIATALEAQVLPVNQASLETTRGVNLLVVGSPTRGFRPSEETAKWLKSLPKSHLKGVCVAAFDTRIWLDTIDSKALRFIVDKGGYAASAIAKTLAKKGGELVAQPEGFLVTGEQGPLMDGELERVRETIQLKSSYRTPPPSTSFGWGGLGGDFSGWFAPPISRQIRS